MLANSMKNPKIIIFFVSWFGAIAGALFTKVANPPQDYLNWIALFALMGVIVANLVLLIIYKLIKSLNQ